MARGPLSEGGPIVGRPGWEPDSDPLVLKLGAKEAAWGMRQGLGHARGTEAETQNIGGLYLPFCNYLLYHLILMVGPMF